MTKEKCDLNCKHKSGDFCGVNPVKPYINDKNRIISCNRYRPFSDIFHNTRFDALAVHSDLED